MVKQVRIVQENKNGVQEIIYPVNTVDDVIVGKLVSGEVALPGQSLDETLRTTLENIRRFLYNIEVMASEKRGVATSLADAASNDIPTVGSLDDMQETLRNLSLSVTTLLSQIDTKAPINHASETTDYGIGTEYEYGHVKIAPSLADAEEVDGVALGIDAGNELQANIDKKAPTVHTSDTGAYGKADTTTYGHVKLSNDYSEETEETGVAASQSAIASLYQNVGTRLIALETDITTKASKNHANSDKSVIGGGTSSVYGHVKLSDAYTASAGDASASVAASSKALYDAYAYLKENSSGGSYVGNTAPTKTNLLWIDTGNGGIIKYYDTETSSWVACPAVWG